MPQIAEGERLAKQLELIQQIRFALSQLRSRNGYPEFEELCLHFSRQAICRNILPATGPVGSSGDQGRDFETYYTLVPGQVQPLGTELGVKEGSNVVFVCTLQTNDVLGKIRDDVASACSKGERINAIIAFCEADVPVGSRHKLQDEVRKARNILLQIHDGNALAQSLAQREYFGLAETFLRLPSELRPDEPETHPQWYVEDKRRWTNAPTVPLTIGAFVDLKDCLRHARQHQPNDIPFWLAKLRLLVAPGCPLGLKQRARYEIVVASIRSLNDARPEEPLIRAYFRNAFAATEATDLPWPGLRAS